MCGGGSAEGFALRTPTFSHRFLLNLFLKLNKSYLGRVLVWRGKAEPLVQDKHTPYPKIKVKY